MAYKQNDDRRDDPASIMGRTAAGGRRAFRSTIGAGSGSYSSVLAPGDGHGDQFDRAAHCPARDRASLIQGILSVL